VVRRRLEPFAAIHVRDERSVADEPVDDPAAEPPPAE
jgi:hypothetical protein